MTRFGAEGDNEAMETLFDPAAPSHFIARIESLTMESRPEWGKMNVEEMLLHTQRAVAIALASEPMARSMVGRLFGWLGKRMFITSGKPFSKNGPTDPRMVFKVESVTAAKVEAAKAKLIESVEEMNRRGPGGMPSGPHPFFGTLTPEEWDLLSAKHIDHHLRQFGV